MDADQTPFLVEKKSDLIPSLDYFTDRRQHIRRFVESLHGTPGDRILFFHGDGGNGKSLLLRKLARDYCKQLPPEEWDSLIKTGDRDVATAVLNAPDSRRVPHVLLDFRLDTSREQFRALTALRRDVAGVGLRFPYFDFAVVSYLQKTHQLTRDRLRDYFPAEGLDLAGDLMDAVTGTVAGSVGRAVLKVFNRKAGPQITLYLQKRKLDEALVARIQSLHPEPDLIELLPKLLAQDLNTSMTLEGAPKRLALFFDTHEAFSGHERTARRAYQRDEWLRTFFNRLKLDTGIVAVVSGREPPRWTEPQWSDLNTRLELHSISGLQNDDARDYLNKRGIGDDALQECILEYTREEPNNIHPWYLGLSADVVDAAAGEGLTLTDADFPTRPETEDTGQGLVDCLLRYANDDVKNSVSALSACRSFDKRVHKMLGDELDFGTNRADFEALTTRYSFIRSVAGDRYRIHDLLRRIVRERDEAANRKAHEVLERYYLERAEEGDEGAQAEAIYHANQLDWERGVRRWVDVFDEALDRSHYGKCRLLLELRHDLEIGDDFWVGTMLGFEGEFYSSVAHHVQAREALTDAVEAYDRALMLTPKDAGALNNKGNSLWQLGSHHAKLSQHQAALTAYTAAVETFDQALALAPEYVLALTSKGTALHHQAELQAQLAAHEDALASYTAAIEALDRALKLAPEFVHALDSKGTALQNQGALQATLAQHKSALASYTAAVEAFDRALTLAPEKAPLLNNKGNALQSRGTLQATLGQHEDALTSYAAAVEAFDRALNLAPEFVLAHTNKGTALLMRGDLHATLAKHEDALTSYTAAVEGFDQALVLAPESVEALNNKGFALRSLGDHQATLAQYEDALASYTAAIEALDQALVLAPESVEALNNKGTALLQRGNLQAQLAEHEDALATYTAAVKALDRALVLAPEYVYALYNKALVLTSRGRLELKCGRKQKAIESYEAALENWDRSLLIAPGNEEIRKVRDKLRTTADDLKKV